MWDWETAYWKDAGPTKQSTNQPKWRCLMMDSYIKCFITLVYFTWRIQIVSVSNNYVRPLSAIFWIFVVNNESTNYKFTLMRLKLYDDDDNDRRWHIILAEIDLGRQEL